MGKVLLLATAPDIPEAHLAVGLAKRGFDLVWMGGGLDTRYGEPIRNSSIHTIPLTLSSRCDVRALRAIRSAVKEFDVKLIHAFSSRAISNAVIATAGSKIPVLGYRGTMAHVSRWDPSNWLTYLHPRVKRIICVCEAVRQSLVTDGVSSERAVTIYKGHHRDWYRTEKSSLQEFGIPKGAVTVSCVARQDVAEAVRTLLTAFSSLPVDISAHALIIGPIDPSTCLPPDISPSVRERIHFTGERPNAAAIVASSSVSFIPSRWRDGLPKKAIEAMIQGVPVIATAAGGLAELIVDGSSGVIIPADNATALNTALKRLLTDAAFARTIRDGALRRIDEGFSIDRTIQQTGELYQQLLEPHEG